MPASAPGLICQQVLVVVGSDVSQAVAGGYVVPQVGADDKEWLVSGMALGGTRTSAWKCQVSASEDL